MITGVFLFGHLQNEPFWGLYLNDGKDLSTVTSPYSVKRFWYTKTTTRMTAGCG